MEASDTNGRKPLDVPLPADLSGPEGKNARRRNVVEAGCQRLVGELLGGRYLATIGDGTALADNTYIDNLLVEQTRRGQAGS